MSVEFRSYVGGEWVASDDHRPNINPSETSDVIGQVHFVTNKDVDAAVTEACDASDSWANIGVQRRSDILASAGDYLFANREIIGRALAREEGKTVPEGTGETIRASQILKYFSNQAVALAGSSGPSTRPGVDVNVSQEPVGVVAAITPWNFPIAIPVWKVAPALAFGNTVVLKPSELTPGMAQYFVDALISAGLPAGVVNLVHGGAEAGEHLVENPAIDAISFTGSTQVGHQILSLASPRGVRVQLEMGGKNPLIVMDDADLANSVQCAVDGAFFSTGQRCTASSRLIVMDSVFDAFADAMKQRMNSLRVGNALHEATDIGPLISQPQLDKCFMHIQNAQDEGASLLAGGERGQADTQGFYLRPTLFGDTSNDMQINRQEVFGPIATLIRVANFEEAIKLANDTEYGLSAGICTRSLQYATEFQRRSTAGMVMVNLPTAGVDYHVPFGGQKASSFGPKEQGMTAHHFYTKSKTSYIKAA